MPFDYRFDTAVARHSVTGGLVKGARGTLHTEADAAAESWGSPLDFIPVGGVQRSDFTADVYGVFPEFDAEHPVVVFRDEAGLHLQTLRSQSYMRDLAERTAIYYPIRPASAGVWTTPPSLPNPPAPFEFYLFDSVDDSGVPAPKTAFPTVQDYHRWVWADGVDPNG